MEKNKKRLRLLFYILGMVISVSLIVILILNSKDSIVKILSEVRTKYLAMAFVSSVIIYVCMGLSLYEILKVMGKKINPFSSIAIALVSTTVNYLISSFGVSGFALRAHLLDRKRVPFGMSVTASIITTVLLYLVLVLIILQGAIMLFFKSHHSAMQMAQTVILIAAMSAICALFIMFLFRSDLRVKFLRNSFRWLNRVLYKLFSAIIPKASYDNFQSQLELGIQAIHQRIGKLTLAVIYICADWLFTMLVLYLAFRSVNVFLSPAELVAGFAVGMMTTLIPILPGGLGAMELAMTAVFNQMGIDWDKALMACLIYRVLYYVIPGIASVFVYWVIQLSGKKNKTNIQEGAAQ